MNKGKKSSAEAENTRIAIVNPKKCKPKKCGLECKRSCPVNKTGKVCISVEKTKKMSAIAESLCIGCGICIKKCPFEAIKIINLPKGIPNETVHRYGPNSFKLFRLPQPKLGGVLGLVGTNGIGKSTALKILKTQMTPNLGDFKDPPTWQDIITHFRGSELQGYFTKMLEEDYKSALKPQYVDLLPRTVKGVAGAIIKKKDKRGIRDELYDILELRSIIKKPINVLSGGELQRFAIMIAIMQKVNVYMFDEPTSYLDVKQRLTVSNCIRKLSIENNFNNYVIVVEHDLSILDYMSDVVCCLYGSPSAYGVVTMPMNVREGINAFLAGFIETDNVRFRDNELTFDISDNFEDVKGPENINTIHYPQFEKKLGTFTLKVEGGSFTNSQIIVLLGENGTGKTTFVKILAGVYEDLRGTVPELKVSFKPQTIAPRFNGPVVDLLWKKIKGIWTKNIIFKTYIFQPMRVNKLMNQAVKKLSGGELQRVGLIVALGKPADVYLIDEPSAYLDCEQRLITSKSIKRFIMHTHKTAFIVEHDFIMATYLADKVIVYEGSPGVSCTANPPTGLVQGMNKFLEILGVTFRRDPTNFRPRINKLNSVLDKEQKSAGDYFSTSR